MRRSLLVVACLLLALAWAPHADAQVDARMLRYPDVSDTHIAFVYAGDIWVVDKAGGTARRLSSPEGEETYPRFSPDGSRIAFSGNYDGNVDIYVVPAMGGPLQRVTWHPGDDRMLEWTPDGRILFASSRHSGVQRYNQLFTVDAAGGLPERLPVPYGEFGALTPDGRQIVYTPKDRSTRNWKRYRGGTAPDVWIFDLESFEARNLSDTAANELQPMVRGRTVYFASDRGPAQRMNLWAHDLDTGEARQLTRFTDRDIAYPAIGPSEIVFQAGGVLHLMDLRSEDLREVDIDVVTDRSTLKPRTVNVGDLIQWAGISPSGARGLFQARGEVFTVPAERGVIRNLTRSAGAADRYPAWSPDGARVAYWSDAGGEYELTLRPAAGGEARVLTDLGPGHRYPPFWSPDSASIAFLDSLGVLRIVDVESGELTEVDRIPYLLHPQKVGFEVSWSSDSRWLAYDKALDTQQGAVFLYDTETGTVHQVTSGYYSDSAPVFDPGGAYLYYLSNRTFEPIYSDVDATWVYPNATNVVAVPLRADVPSPLAPRNDEEEVADEGDEGDGDSGPGAEAGREDGVESAGEETGESAGVEIDLDGFESRAVVLPAQPGNYSALRAVAGHVVYHRRPRSGAGGGPSPVVAWSLESREEAPIVPDASSFEVASGGGKLLVGQRGSWFIVDARPGQELKAPLATSEMQTTLVPREEWRQIFNEVWRAYRDFFYDPDLHGLDWEGLREVYGTLVEQAVTRWDVNAAIGELIAEVNASHTYVGGGDTETPERRAIGFLGVDWALEDGAYRIARIVRGAPWDVEARSPLDAPGVDVDEGDWVLAVNGVPMDTARSPHAAFEGLAGDEVLLTVNDRPTLEGAREVLVQTLEGEARLRHLEWIEANRRRVEEATDGRVGYVFVPNTAVPGQNELVRQLGSQVRKHGLIVDERFNAGGQLPDRFIEKFDRQLVNRIYFRGGDVVNQPNVSVYGPKVMLINGWAGSGGDAFPYFFRTLGVGPIIGERTWGGLIGPAVGMGTIDGGGFTAPPGRIYGPDGEWFAEGHGVEPDIPVVDHPTQLARGVDPQLEAAIEEVMRLIEEQRQALPEPPSFERRTGDDG